MIRKEIKFVSTEAPYWDFKTEESAKASERRSVIEKYVDPQIPASPTYGYKFYGLKEKFRKFFRDGYEEGFNRGARKAREEFLKFYDDIMDKLAIVDTQKVKDVV